jgi:hypothetical protein
MTKNALNRGMIVQDEDYYYKVCKSISESLMKSMIKKYGYPKEITLANLEEAEHAEDTIIKQLRKEGYLKTTKQPDIWFNQILHRVVKQK